jgi:transposase InsO family protein
VKTVAETLGVARSSLVKRLAGGARARGAYAKAGDAALLARVRSLVDQRPTYGYRRITALVNRELAVEGEALANHKRVYRVMKAHGLLLTRNAGRRSGRLHDGKVIVIRSNLRWCSDALEFTCWNGEIVRLAFIIDAHDREIVAWRAVTGTGISGSDVRDMMLEAVEIRFGALRTPHKVEFLTDNASAYTAQDTRIFATQLGLAPCFTPVASPESNGMAEAFVRTFKRDYLRVNPVQSAASALTQIAGWIADYNDIHPHSGLRMRSPREFRRAQQPAEVSA